MRTDTDYQVTLSEDGRTATLTFDLSEPTTRPATSSGKAYSVASSHGWQDFGQGLRLSLNLVLSKRTAEAAAEAAALSLAPAPEAVTEDKPAPRTRSRKAA